jgi:hypothetical protein
MLYNSRYHTFCMHNQINTLKVSLACYLRAPVLCIEPSTGCLGTLKQHGFRGNREQR